jgi:hypothetical protein
MPKTLTESPVPEAFPVLYAGSRQADCIPIDLFAYLPGYGMVPPHLKPLRIPVKSLITF